MNSCRIHPHRNSLFSIAALLLGVAFGIPPCVLEAQPPTFTLRLETTSVQRMPLVVMPFSSDTASSWTGDLPQTLRGLIEEDLATCGYFNILDPTPYAADTASLFLTLPNQPSRIIGSVEAGWSAVTADIGITQPPAPTPIQMREFRFVADELRPNAHRISAWITKMLTGEDGAFTSRIAFVARQNKDKHLWIMDWDGASPQALTQDGDINISPHWTPDGAQLFFTSFRRGNADIYRYDLGTGRISAAFSGPGVDSAPAVSPDGQWVAFSSSVDGNAEIFRMRPDGTQRTRLTVSWGIDTSPTWSPTGRELAFTSDRGGSPQIWRMDFDGGNVRRISFMGDYNDSPTWSPRGDLIAYAGRNGDFQIITITPEGTNARQLTSPPGASYDPAWSPDGMKIAFTSTRGGSEAIWVMNWDGSNPHKITSGFAAMAPQWGPIEPVK